jgi:hypothetical protein
MSRIAVIVGIDNYPGAPLRGCVADARAIQAVLKSNADGSPNFHCKILPNCPTRAALRGAADDLFRRDDVDVALFYFAGHGAYRHATGGLLVTPDHQDGDEGVPMEHVIGLANHSKAAERVIILDCCHAGAIDELVATKGPVPLAEGVSIIAACRPTQYAEEQDGRGICTRMIEGALAGGSADVRGRVTIASIYAYLDEVLAGWDQRPLFRGSLSKLTSLRRAPPAVTDDKLRRLTALFPSPSDEYSLDPSYEPSAKPQHREHESIFSLLQEYRAAGLLEPVGTPHLYYAAMERKSCRLTMLGEFYWRAVQARNV